MTTYKLHSDREVQTIEPGTYRLTRDITNPSADRRSPRDWHKRPTFKAGDLFVVIGDAEKDVLHPETDEPIGRKFINTYQRIQRIGSKHYDTLLVVDEAGQALIAGFERIEETFEAQCMRINVNDFLSADFIGRLIERGYISRDKFEAEWNEWINEGADES